MRTLRIKCSKNPFLTVERSKQKLRRMVYILVANKYYRYPKNKRKSRIIYIGTTGKGARRPAASAVDKASEAFRLRGVKKIEVHIVTCAGRKAVKTWKKLEAALIAAFWERYFDIPEYNKIKGGVRSVEDVSLFRPKALQKLLLRFGE